MKQSKEFYLGYQNYAYGKTTNPYEENTVEHEEWQNGFDLAEDDESLVAHNSKHTRRSVEWGYSSDNPE
jgi:hypothetical protein